MYVWGKKEKQKALAPIHRLLSQSPQLNASVQTDSLWIKGTGILLMSAFLRQVFLMKARDVWSKTEDVWKQGGKNVCGLSSHLENGFSARAAIQDKPGTAARDKQSADKTENSCSDITKTSVT